MAKKAFTEEERNLLVKFIKENVSIIENKSNDFKMIKAKKEKWMELSNVFTSNGFDRNWRRLRQYYQRAKSSAKKSISAYKKQQHGTENGQSSSLDIPSDFDWALHDICPVDFTTDVSTNDSDQQPSNAAECLLDSVTCILEESSSEYQSSSESSECASRKKQKINIFSEKYLNDQLNLLHQRNRREQKLHQARMRVEEMKLKNEELIAEKLKLEIERLRK